jgi:hypothetical protein
VSGAVALPGYIHVLRTCTRMLFGRACVKLPGVTWSEHFSRSRARGAGHAAERCNCAAGRRERRERRTQDGAQYCAHARLPSPPLPTRHAAVRAGLISLHPRLAVVAACIARARAVQRTRCLVPPVHACCRRQQNDAGYARWRTTGALLAHHAPRARTRRCWSSRSSSSSVQKVLASLVTQGDAVCLKACALRTFVSRASPLQTPHGDMLPAARSC